MRVALAFGLVLISALSYFALVIALGIFQRYPIPHYLGIAVGLLWLTKLLAERRSVVRIATLIVATAIGGLYVWYTLSYSNYAARELKMREGETVAALTSMALADHEGQTRPVLGDGNSPTLLVFYRGFW